MKLKELRLLRNLTQQAVADYIGVSAIVYSRYERGTREPPIDTLIKLSEFFDVSVDHMIGNAERTGMILTEYEVNLVKVSREADDRSKIDALEILIRHKI